MSAIIAYLIHASKNAARARDWVHLDLLLDELSAEVAQLDAPEPAKPKEWWRTFNRPPGPGNNPARVYGTIDGDVHYR